MTTRPRAGDRARWFRSASPLKEWAAKSLTAGLQLLETVTTRMAQLRAGTRRRVLEIVIAAMVCVSCAAPAAQESHAPSGRASGPSGPTVTHRGLPSASSTPDQSGTHRSTDGKVLVVGGCCTSTGGAIASAELYNPGNGP